MQYTRKENGPYDQFQMVDIKLQNINEIHGSILQDNLNPNVTIEIQEELQKNTGRQSHHPKPSSKYSLSLVTNSHNQDEGKQEKELQRFKLYTIPPDIRKCYFHQTVTQFGIPTQNNVQFRHQTQQQQSANESSFRSSANKQLFNDKKQCQCCGQQPQQKLHVCCKVEDVYKLNQSLGFYFTYIKVMFLMLLLIAIVLGSYSLKELIDNCSNQVDCMQIYGITILKFHVFFNSINTILVAFVVIIMYFFCIFLYYTNAHQHRKVFLNVQKPSNFSALISNVDHSKVSEKAILDYFNGYEIENILYTHQIKQYLSKLSKRSKLIALKTLYENKDQSNDISQKISKLNMKIDSINEYLFEIKKNLTPHLQKTVRTDKVIIKFKTIQEKIRFDYNYRKNFCQFIQQTFCNNSLIEINNHKIFTQHLGEPHQIIWQNFQVNSTKRLLRVIVGFLLSIIALAVSYFFAAIITKLEQTHTGSSDYLLSILFSIGVQVSNLFIEQIIERLTQWEKRYTLTSQYRVILIKNFLLYFLNTTIMPFSFFIFDWGSKSQDDQILNIFTVFCILNFQLPIPFVTNFLRLPHIIKLMMKRKIQKQGNNCLITQIEANKYFERFDFQLHLKFAKIIQIVSNAAFYAAVFPLGLLITMAGLILTYWSSKAFLLKYCTFPKQSYRLGRLVNDITVFFPTILTFGYALNELMIPGKTEFNRIVPLIIGALTIPIAILFTIFGHKLAQKFVSKIQQRIMKNQCVEQKGVHKNYKDIRGLDYRYLNPTSFLNTDQNNKIKEIDVSKIEGKFENYVIEQERRNSQ